MSHGLPFEIGDSVRFTALCEAGSFRNKRSRGRIHVVGLDISDRHSIKVAYFVPGSGQLYAWVTEEEIRKLSVIERLAAVDDA